MGAGTVPVVLIGRYTTLAGTDPFSMSPIVVAEYSSIQLSVWRGPLDGIGQLQFDLEESMDRVTWTSIDSRLLLVSGEISFDVGLSRTWLRPVVTLAGPAFPVVSCYAVGFLVKRRA
ncbi:MAG: hypothetical protein L6Q95_06965 [Planctomycetes bacterium]|nr:hypothetical protein [Planctomycetota bacterium]